MTEYDGSILRVNPPLTGWTELGRTTLGGDTETINVTGLTAKPYMMVLAHLTSDITNADMGFQFNGDTGTNYATRTSQNGGADYTGTSLTYVRTDAGILNMNAFDVSFINNIASEEKLVITETAKQQASGAGTAPSRQETVSKWANTANDITRVEYINAQIGTQYYASGDEVVVLGWDPADTNNTPFWEELASVELSVNGNLSTGTFTAKKYLWVQTFFKPTSANTSGMVMNNDTAYNYSNRRSKNDGAEETRTSSDSLAGIQLNGNYTEGDWAFATSFIINKSDKEKLAINEFIGQNTAGAANAPDRVESVGKWTNTSSQITEIDITDGAGLALTLTSGSFIRVWGAD